MKTADIQTADGRLVASSGTRSLIPSRLRRHNLSSEASAKEGDTDRVGTRCAASDSKKPTARLRKGRVGCPQPAAVIPSVSSIPSSATSVPSPSTAALEGPSALPCTRSPLHPVTLSWSLLVSLSLLLLVSLSSAKLPEPDAIYFGTAKHNGGATLYPSGTEMLLRAELNGVPVASATINPDGTFVLKVPVDDGQEPRIQGAARGNERVRVFLRNTDLSLEAEVSESVGLGVVVPNLRGDLTDTDFTVTGDFGGLPPPPPGFDEFMGGYGYTGIPGEMNLDLDGDGFSNVDEFITGTDPTSGTAAIRVLDIINNGNVTSVQFGPVRISRLYRLWCTDDLGVNGWSEVGQLRPTTNADSRWIDLLNEGQQHLFFKVEVELE